MAGYNTKIEHNGITYIVQTQDLGSPSHCIESLIYRSGKTLPPRKTFYTHLLNKPTLKDDIQRLLEEQHKNILHAIKNGRYDKLGPV